MRPTEINIEVDGKPYETTESVTVPAIGSVISLGPNGQHVEHEPGGLKGGGCITVSFPTIGRLQVPPHPG